MVNNTSENNNSNDDYVTDYHDGDHHQGNNNNRSKSDVSHDDEQKTIKPIQLSGLRQALYIIKRLDAGEYVDQIVERFEGDKQLVQLWMSFLLHNKYIQNPIDHKWIITERGRQWIEKHGRRGINSTDATRAPKN